jgi:TPR repeat protein
MSNDIDEVVNRFEETLSSFTCKGSGIDANEQSVKDAISYMVSKEYKKAVSLFEKPANEGHMGAQYALGELYMEGKGVDKDERKAVYWFTKSAEQGHQDAQANLGTLFYNGYDVPKNRTKAKYWHSLAAKQGNEVAKRNLYKLDYYDGKLIVYSVTGAILLGIVAGMAGGFVLFLLGAIGGWIIGRIIRKRI